MTSHSRRVTRLALLLIPLALLLMGADSDSGADDIPSLEGRWAQKVVMTSVSDPPIVGKVTSQTVTLLRVDLTQQKRSVELASETCDIEMTSDSNAVETVIPRRFVQAVPDGTRSGTLVASETGPTLRIPRQDSLLGVQLRQPTHETLPDSADDPRVVDADKDGHPGVTIRIEGMINGAMYLVQRAWDAYTGEVHSDESITGHVEWNTEQSIVGSTSMFLKSQPPTDPHADKERNRFEMVRIPQNASCRWIVRNQKRLFGR